MYSPRKSLGQQPEEGPVVDSVVSIETNDPAWIIAIDTSTGESVLTSIEEFVWDGFEEDSFVSAHYVDEFGDEFFVLYDSATDQFNMLGTNNQLAYANVGIGSVIVKAIKAIFTKTPKKAPPMKLPVTKVPGKKPPLKAGEKVESEHTLPDGTVIRKIKTPEGPIRIDETPPITVGSGQPGAPGVLPVNPPPANSGTP
ncbi:MAG: hypothetical protein FJ308_17770 [Planctomycetes bacterium]|nr:hypothetical protein [Planctomycetota bacterium]